MKALIITYYWPPAGGSGVQRWLKFVKYLQEFGITPVVYTVKNPEYAIEDATLQSEIPEGVVVIRQPIWEPYTWANFFLKKRSAQTKAGFLSKKPSLLGKLVTYIRANCFIPDARVFWVKPSISYLQKYLKENPVDVVITTGPPHSMHLIGLGLKEKMNLKWMADFRDPWTAIDYFHHLPFTEKSKQKHHALEREVLERSDAVLVVGKTMQQDYLKYNAKAHVISNGFDTEISRNDQVLDRTFSITHIGMMNEDRNPMILWKVLSELRNEIAGFFNDLEIKLVGKVAPAVLDTIVSEGLGTKLQHIDYLPHKKVLHFQQKSQVLLLSVNKVPSAKGIVTGKIFEYIIAKRPILAIGPEGGDLAEIIKQTNSGTIISFEDYQKLKEEITEMYANYLKGDLSVKSRDVNRYHRKEITKQLAQLIKDI